MKYRVGNLVNCRVNKDKTIVFDVEFEDSRYQIFPVQIFEIIGYIPDGELYILLVSEQIDDSVSWKIDQKRIEKYNISPKHLEKFAVFLSESSIGGRTFIDPYENCKICIICKQYIPYIEEDNYICWSCRMDPRNKENLNA